MGLSLVGDSVGCPQWGPICVFVFYFSHRGVMRSRGSIESPLSGHIRGDSRCKVKQNIAPMESTLGCSSKVWQYKVESILAPLLLPNILNCWEFQLKKALSLVWETPPQAWVQYWVQK